MFGPLALPQRGIPLSMAVAATLVAAACGGDNGTEPTPTEQKTGTVTVSVTTAGVELDVDGYQIRIDGALKGNIAVDGSLTLSDLSVGARSVSLEGLARNCAVSGANPATATVAADQTTSVAFEVLCAEDLGSLHIVTSTEGRVLDPDGYSVTVDGDVEEALGIDDEVTLQLKPGTHTITLQGQAANCAPRGLPEATATVPFGDTKDVTFELVCFEDPIVFERERNSDGRDLWVVDASGGPEVRLTDDPVNLDYSGLSISGSAWNPGHTHVVFQSAPVSSFTDYDIYVLALNKSEMFHLQEDGTQVQPQWSPDGSRILFGDFGPGRFADIFVADPQLTEVTNITQSAVWENAATWSPDGSRILAVADPASGPPSGALVVFNADGSGRVDLSEIVGGHDAGVNDQDPRWSPDGSKIAFLRYREENLEGDIWVADADGSNAVRLTDTPNDGKFELLWSPDGSTLYYSLCPDCTTSSGPATTDVWAMAVDGSSNVQVTDSGDEAPGAFNATTTFAGEVPAGTSLVTVNGILSIGLQLYRMAPDGSGRVAITSTQGSANNPHWR